MPHPPRDRDRIAIVDGPGTGRHALDEEAQLTPIFHALTGRFGARPAPVDPVERFRRDPLTVPIPVTVPAGRRARARTEPTGRHHLRRTPAWLPH